MNRRSFLKVAASASAALALPACQTSPTPTIATPITTTMPTATPKQTETLVTLPGSDTWTVTSQMNGQEYRIFIKIPKGQENTPLPVIYLTDGNLNFQMTCAIFAELVGDQYIKPAIIVGIGYLLNEYEAYEDLRARDFTHTTIAPLPDIKAAFPSGTGGAAKFLRFLVEELKPMIDLKYKTLSNDSTLVGHSFGGLFALYALFQEQAPFQRYIIGSPAISWDNSRILDQMAKFCDGRTDLPARVFMGVGDKEDSHYLVKPMQALVEKLTQYKFPNLMLKSQLFADETHRSVIPFFISRGLRAVMESN